MLKLLCTVLPAVLKKFFEEIGESVFAVELLPPPPMDLESLKRIQIIAEALGQVLYPPDFLNR